jgi:hypothetical protein
MCLGGLLEKVGVLLELGGHAHVAELVAQRDHQAADQGRIHLTGSKGIVSRDDGYGVIPCFRQQTSMHEKDLG